MSLLKLLKSNPEDLLRCKTLRFPIKPGKNEDQLQMGSTGSVPFDLIENGEYADFVPKAGSSDVAAWAEFPNNYADTKLEGTNFALTAPLTGCTAGALSTGMWFHRAANCSDTRRSVATMRAEKLNFIYGPEQYQRIGEFYGKDDSVQVILFGMQTADTKWTFWAQWQKRGTSMQASRLLWNKVGTYPNV